MNSPNVELVPEAVDAEARVRDGLGVEVDHALARGRGAGREPAVIEHRDVGHRVVDRAGRDVWKRARGMR